ncbi:hypothetical protein SAY87_028569 [Trapa incisa]|uniref:PUM-HD domain-containing protein n=1 Tax=Trapa incisa TaxID=236973 RepID=A0AAN7KV45_9MYRT|nr:hypothetical protein SAY87_028569 [Trapa incisa]
MGENKREVETDEADELLGEIPKATSGNPNYQDFHSKVFPINSCKRHSSQNFPKTQCPQPRNMASVNILPSAFSKTAQSNEPKLPDEQSLTSAFAELNIGYGNQYSKVFSTHHVNLDPRMSNLGFDGISEARIWQQNSDLCLIDLVGLKNLQSGRCPQIGGSSVPFSAANNEVQFVPNLPVFPLDLPAANHQQYMMDTQSMLPYFHIPVDQSSTAWMDMEKENFYRACVQNLYYHQSLNRYFEAHQPLQSNGPLISKRQQFCEIPVSQCPEQQEGFLRGYGLTRCLKPQNIILSSPDISVDHAFDRISPESFSEKNIMRPTGYGSLRPLRFSPGNDMIYHIKQKGKVASNDQLSHCLGDSNKLNCFQKEGINYFKSSDLSLLPLKYNWCTNDISNRTYFMAKDQQGCRLLQKKISEGGRKDVEKVFIEIFDHMVELMTDPFGNYLVQKLLEVCNEDQQTRILKVITRNTGDLTRISCDMHGTRVVQKVIETLKTPEQISIVVNSLKPCIVILMKNSNGNHVAQRCLQHLMPKYSQFIFDAAAENCVELATDRHGCCVLQKCLNFSFGKQRRRLIHEITSNALVLSQDPFGNYVVQFIFELDVPHTTNEVLDQLEGNFADLSMQKYSSNVVEKCLEYAGVDRRAHIIQELVGDPRLDQIMQDPFGNYVIQAVLNCSEGDQKSALIQAIEAHVPVLRTSPYGKKVLSCNSLKK